MPDCRCVNFGRLMLSCFASLENESRSSFIGLYFCEVACVPFPFVCYIVLITLRACSSISRREFWQARCTLAREDWNLASRAVHPNQNLPKMVQPHNKSGTTTKMHFTEPRKSCIISGLQRLQRRFAEKVKEIRDLAHVVCSEELQTFS